MDYDTATGPTEDDYYDYTYTVDPLLHFLVPQVLLQSGVVLSHIVLIVVILMASQTRVEPINWLMLTLAGNSIIRSIINVLFTAEFRLQVSLVVHQLCEFCRFLHNVTDHQIRLCVFWLTITVICKTLGKEFPKWASLIMIIGGTVFSIIWEVVYIFGAGNGYIDYGPSISSVSCSIYVNIAPIGEMVYTCLSYVVYPMLVIVCIIFLGVMYGKTNKETRGYHRGVLVLVVILFCCNLPYNIVRLLLVFFEHHIFADWQALFYSAGFVTQVAMIVMSLVWLFVPDKMRAAYCQFCCCCYPDTEQDEERVELLK